MQPLIKDFFDYLMQKNMFCWLKGFLCKLHSSAPNQVKGKFLRIDAFINQSMPL